MSRIQVDIHDDKRIVCVWLAKSESDDPRVQMILEPLYRQYRPQKYTVAVFRSGKQELCGLTSDLLKYNRRLLAEQELQSEQMNG